MSDSESEQVSGEDPAYESADEAPREQAPPATPEPEHRSPAGRPGKVLLMSPAWIKQKGTPKTMVDTVGYDCDSIGPDTDIVLVSIPGAARLEDLHGKQLMLPDQAGARADIDGYRYEAVRGPDESSKDLHLLSTIDGVANSKPVSSVYSLQMRLGDVPADEEPIDESVLQSIQKALAAAQPNGADGTASTKKRKSKHGRSSRLTGDPKEHDGPQLDQQGEPAAPVAPPSSDGNEAPENSKSKKQRKQKKAAGGNSDEHTAAASGDAEAGGADAGEESDSKKKHKKKKKKKRKRAESADDVEEPAEDPEEKPALEILDEAVEVEDLVEDVEMEHSEAEEARAEEDAEEEGAEVDVEAAEQGEDDPSDDEAAIEEDVDMEDASDMVVERQPVKEDPANDASHEAELEADHQASEEEKPKKKRKRAKSAADALGAPEAEEGSEEKQKKKKKKKRAQSMGALEPSSPVAKKKKKGKK